MPSESTSSPLIIAGPLLRRCTPTEVVLWLVTDTPCACQLHISLANEATLLAVPATECNQQSLQVGQRAFLHWLRWSPASPLAENTVAHYDIKLTSAANDYWLTQLVDQLHYEGATHPHFKVSTTINEVVHGSCRKPHHKSRDSLVQLDKRLAASAGSPTDRPDFLMMTGDQVYVDDVAGPMLAAIHQVIERLGLFDEELPGAKVKQAGELYAHADSYYRRDRLLPDDDEGKRLKKRFWFSNRKSIFTSVNSNNHLITFAEVMAMYLLTWSPTLWDGIDLDKPNIPWARKKQYQKEKLIIQQFADGLWQVRRMMAHIPCYMIFDDHDITDDWNLTRGWEEAAYGHPFSKRIIGNALLGYLLCQGIGNNPQAFLPLNDALTTCFDGSQVLALDPLIEQLFEWREWHYQLPTQPPTLVLDTRTQRWRSESNRHKPSGLMDWEPLCDLQQQLIGHDSVLMISPAPIYGVKLIEVVQKVFTFFGKALAVDAENWMAHKGTASVILNIFRHKSTPPLFIILSGDVHYSFVYNVKLRFSRSSPQIFQITASGIKNEFPRALLLLLDKLNRWIFHRYSPFNWLTRRRGMSIQPCKPPGDKGRTLLNASGLGVLNISSDRQQLKMSILTSEGNEVEFEQQ